jgi:hypothetical protein
MDRMVEPARVPCPECGQLMRRLPALGGGFLFTCPKCGYERADESTDDIAPTADEPSSDEPAARFRRLLAAPASPEEGDWPESLLDDLPDELRAKLDVGRSEPPAQGERGAQSGGPDDVMQRHLREHGYYLSLDHQGPHLTGSGPRPGTGDLTPYDLVRLAAELDGGVPDPEDQIRCPSCQAMIPRGRRTCQWCGQEVPEAGQDPDG